jgi:pyruvate dehydrogenase E2 component (dihydrolipoamide acetyltransferase)
MPINVTMPRLSDTMEQGTVVKWHVKVGDKVASGQVIADIDKRSSFRP